MIKYIFISYINRSGSTLFTNILSKRKGVFVCTEANILFDLFLENPLNYSGNSSLFKTRFLNAITFDQQLKLWDLKKVYKNSLIPKGQTNFKMFLDLLNTYKKQISPKSEYIVFKHNNLFQLMNRASLNPQKNIFFIILLRDVRGVFASQRKTLNPYTKKIFNTNPLITAYPWKNLVFQALKALRLSNVFVLKYENLVLNNKKCIRELFNKFNIPCPDFESNDSLWIENRIPVKEKNMHPIIQFNPIHEKINSWENELSNSDISILQDVAGSELRQLRYDLNTTYQNNLIIIIKKYYFKIRLVLKIDKFYEPR